MKDRIILEGGHKKVFLRKEKNFISKFYNNYSFSNTNINTWKIFEKFLFESHEDDIELIIIILPMHARHLNTISLTKNWTKYENWKKRLIKSNNEISKIYKKKKFDIWDFALLNEITMEQVPNLNENIQMEWWWDSHFKAEFGDIIISLIHDDEEKKGIYQERLGKKINLDNIDHHLSSLRVSLDNWKNNFRTDHEEIVSLFRESR